MNEYRKCLTAIPIGILTGLLTVYVVPGKFEIVIWLILIVAIGWLCNTYYSGKIFLKAFAFAVLAGVFITLTHITFLRDYLLSHPEETEALNEISLWGSDRLTLLAIAPVYWIVLGLLSGFTAKIIQRITNKI